VDTDCDGNDDDADGDGVGLGADCDDADPAVSPEVAERGGNGLDDDCDGRVDESTGGGGKGGCASHTGGPGAGLALLAALALLSRRRGA
jgi:MYXO-CTERM domain-containing protein